MKGETFEQFIQRIGKEALEASPHLDPAAFALVLRKLPSREQYDRCAREEHDAAR